MSSQSRMSREELATLCMLLDKFDSLADNSVKGAIETAFYEVWEIGRKGSGTLTFYRAIREAAENQ